MADRRTRKLGFLALAFWGCLSLSPRAGRTAPPKGESALLAEVRAWHRELAAEAGRWANAEEEIAIPQSDGSGEAPGDVRGLLGDIPRQLAAWREIMASIEKWEAEQPPYFDREGELVGKARAYAVERRNRRAILGAVAQFDRILADWPTVHWRFLVARRQRLERIVEALAAPDTYAVGIAELKSWQDEFRDDPRFPPADGDGSRAGEMFLEVRRKTVALLALEDEREALSHAGSQAGQAAILVRAAADYPRELRARQRVQGDMGELASLVEQWQRAEWREIAAAAGRIARLFERADNRPPRLPTPPPGLDLTALKSNIENFEYYELPGAMSLRQASAEPLVYGDPDKWPRLLEANPETATSPDAELAAGTLLVVPRTFPAQP